MEVHLYLPATRNKHDNKYSFMAYNKSTCSMDQSKTKTLVLNSFDFNVQEWEILNGCGIQIISSF